MTTEGKDPVVSPETDSSKVAHSNESPRKRRPSVNRERSVHRVRFLKTHLTQVPVSKQQRDAEEYEEFAFRSGVFDGSNWITDSYGREVVGNAADLDRLASYPLHLRKRVGRIRERFTLLTERVDWATRRLPLLQSRLESSEKELRQAEEERNEWLRRAEPKPATTGEADQAVPWWHRATRALSSKMLLPPKQNPLGLASTGVALLIAWVVLVFADLAISFGAIYSFGLKAPSGGGNWTQIVFQTAKWTREWDGLAICFGIAAMTFLFKLFYEKLKYRHRDGVDPLITLVWAVIFLGAVLAVALLATLRIEYVLLQPNGVQIPKTLARWGTITSSVLFLIGGAICLSEGLHALAESWTLLRKPKESALHEDEKHSLYRNGVPEALIQRLDSSRAAFDRLTREERETREQLWRDKGRLERLTVGLETLKQRLENHDLQWEKLGVVDARLYELGRDHGERAHRADGAYELLLDRLRSAMAKS